MSALNPGVYGTVLRVRQARLFDLGCLLMRICPSMASIGTMTMLTLSGSSFLAAGLVSSTIALSTFLIAPRVSKLVDAYGQSRVVPFAAAVTLVGLGCMLALVQFGGPVWALVLAAVAMGCTPSPQALARARWTYLIRSERLGSAAPELRTMFSYEGMLDDIGYLFSPSVSIALASTVAPQPGWDSRSRLEGAVAPNRARRDAESATVDNGAFARQKSVFRTSATVRVLFAIMLFEGAFYGVIYTALTSFVEGLGAPAVASVVLMAASVISMAAGLVFGMVKLKASPQAQITACSVAFGLAHATLAFASSMPTLFAAFAAAALSYAPFLIVVNATCERAVPGDRLTEAITWVNAGSTCGMAFGPTAGGALVDALGANASFAFGAVLALAVPATVLASRTALKRDLGNAG